MSWILADHVMRMTDQSLSSTELWILTQLASFADEDGTSIFPSLTTLAKRTRLTKQCVIDTIKKLLNKGILIKMTDNSSVRKPNVYKINIEIVLKILPEQVSSGEQLEVTCNLTSPEQVNDIDQLDVASQQRLTEQVNDIDQTIQRRLPYSVTYSVLNSVREREEALPSQEEKQTIKEKEEKEGGLPAKKKEGDLFTAESPLTEEMRAIALDEEIHPDKVEKKFNECKAYQCTKLGRTFTKNEWLETWRKDCTNAPEMYRRPRPSWQKTEESSPLKDGEAERFALAAEILAFITDPILQDVRSAILEKVGWASYTSWFKELRIDLDGSTIFFRTTSPHRKDHVESHFRDHINMIVRKIGGYTFEIT